MITRAWLVQRGFINKPYNDYKDMKLSNAVDLAYMGSSNFEGGALGRSLRQLQTSAQNIIISNYVFKNEIHESHDLSGTLRILHALSEEDYQTYLQESLIPLFNNQLGTEELTYFGRGSIRYNGQRSNIDFWWDIENHVMWSFDKIFMKRILNHLKASWAYMDTQLA